MTESSQTALLHSSRRGGRSGSMTAILLAAGVGKRMGPGAGPKCLLSVGGKSLLQRMLEGLRAIGVTEVVLVVGFQKDRVMAEARRFSDWMRLHQVENERFREGAILSLWSAREFLDRNLFIMDADVLCPPALLERLRGSPYTSCLLVDGAAQDTGEEQLVLGSRGRVMHIAKRPSQEIRKRWDLFGESVGFLKLAREGAVQLRSLLEERVRSGEHSIEHEQLYPQLFETIFVGFERIDGLPWTEIDTPEDLRRANHEVYTRWFPPKCLNRMISGGCMPWIARLPLSPNQWTGIGLLLGLLALSCMAQGRYGWSILGAVLFQLFYLADSWDGELARWRGVSSRLGGWLDVCVDAVIHVVFPMALAAGLIRRGAPAWVSTLGGAASLGMVLDFMVTLWAKARGFGPAVFSDVSPNLPEPSKNRIARWLSANASQDNFGFLVMGMLILDLPLPFLAATAVGSHLFWMQYLWRERGRLVFRADLPL